MSNEIKSIYNNFKIEVDRDFIDFKNSIDYWIEEVKKKIEEDDSEEEKMKWSNILYSESQNYALRLQKFILSKINDI
jgi:hypothetical protein